MSSLQPARDAPPRGAPHHLRQHEAAAHRVVLEQRAGAPRAAHLRQQVHHLLRVGEQLEVDGLRGQVGNAGAVRQHVADRDPALAVVMELGHVVRDAVLEVEDALLVELVHHHRRHGLRGRVEAEGRVDPDQPLRRVGRVARRVPRGVAEGAVQDRRAVAAEADLDRRVGTSPVEVLDRPPDGVHRRPGGPSLAGRLLGPDHRDLLEVRRHAAEGHEGELAQQVDGVHGGTGTDRSGGSGTRAPSWRASALVGFSGPGRCGPRAAGLETGVGEGTRTPDPRNHNPML